MNDVPLVSICCLSFNHAPFIRKCLDGFLMQETTFPVEILIHDDASTDGTDNIIREYAEKHPDRIFPLFEEENKYSHGYAGKMDFFNYNRARGKYIATCEGDDYWTDSLKLQKQVDFMESHPEYSVCFHRCRHWYANSDKYIDDGCGFLFSGEKDGVEVTKDVFLEHWVTQPLSMVFRNSSFCSDWRRHYKYYRDVCEIYHLLKEGKGYLFAFFGGVYTLHTNGISSLIEREAQYPISYHVAKELYENNKDVSTKRYFARNLRWLIKSKAKIEGVSRFSMIYQYCILTGDLKYIIKCFFSK